MTQNKNGVSGLVKGLFIGGLLGASAAVLYMARNGATHRSTFSKGGVRVRLQDRPSESARAELIVEPGKPGRPTFGWLALSIVASVVAMISDFRMRKR